MKATAMDPTALTAFSSAARRLGADLTDADVADVVLWARNVAHVRRLLAAARARLADEAPARPIPHVVSVGANEVDEG